MRSRYGNRQNRLLIRMISTPKVRARNLRKQLGGALSPLEAGAEMDLYTQNQTFLMCKLYLSMFLMAL